MKSHPQFTVQSLSFFVKEGKHLKIYREYLLAKYFKVHIRLNTFCISNPMWSQLSPCGVAARRTTASWNCRVAYFFSGVMPRCSWLRQFVPAPYSMILFTVYCFGVLTLSTAVGKRFGQPFWAVSKWIIILQNMLTANICKSNKTRYSHIQEVN